MKLKNIKANIKAIKLLILSVSYGYGAQKGINTEDNIDSTYDQNSVQISLNTSNSSEDLLTTFDNALVFSLSIDEDKQNHIQYAKQTINDIVEELNLLPYEHFDEKISTLKVMESIIVNTPFEKEELLNYLGEIYKNLQKEYSHKLKYSLDLDVKGAVEYFISLEMKIKEEMDDFRKINKKQKKEEIRKLELMNKDLLSNIIIYCVNETIMNTLFDCSLNTKIDSYVKIFGFIDLLKNKCKSNELLIKLLQENENEMIISFYENMGDAFFQKKSTESDEKLRNEYSKKAEDHLKKALAKIKNINNANSLVKTRMDVINYKISVVKNENNLNIDHIVNELYDNLMNCSWNINDKLKNHTYLESILCYNIKNLNWIKKSAFNYYNISFLICEKVECINDIGEKVEYIHCAKEKLAESLQYFFQLTDYKKEIIEVVKLSRKLERTIQNHIHKYIEMVSYKTNHFKNSKHIINQYYKSLEIINKTNIDQIIKKKLTYDLCVHFGRLIYNFGETEFSMISDVQPKDITNKNKCYAEAHKILNTAKESLDALNENKIINSIDYNSYKTKINKYLNNIDGFLKGY